MYMRVRYIMNRYRGSLSEKRAESCKGKMDEGGKVEKQRGAVAKDEEEMAEAGEVEKEKRVMHKCEECVKNVSPSK